MAGKTKERGAKPRTPAAPTPVAPSVPAWSNGRRRALVAGLVGLVVALVWSPALRNGFCSDDVFLVVENPVLSQPGAFGKAFTQDFWSAPTTGWQRDYYRPLANVSYVVDSRLHGRNAAGFHATNVVAHGLVAALLVLLSCDLGFALPTAAAGAFLFGVHPALAEVVAWISGRTDLLAGLWVLVYLLLDGRRERLALRLLSLASLALALLTKEVAAVAPALAVGVDLCRDASLSSALRRRWDAGCVLAGFLILRVDILGAVVTHGQPAIQGIDLRTRLAALPHLLGALLLPWFSRTDYGAGLPAPALLAAAGAGVVLAAVLVFAAARAQRRRRDARPGRGAALDPLVFLVLAAAASFAPLGAAVLLKSTISTRLLYFPALFIMPACAALALRWRSQIAWIGLGVLAVAFAGTSIARIPRWSSTRAFWDAAVAEPHASALAHCNLAKGQHDEGVLGPALQQLDEGLNDRPSSVGHQLRAVIYTEIGCYDLALQDYRRALDLSPGTCGRSTTTPRRWPSWAASMKATSSSRASPGEDTAARSCGRTWITSLASAPGGRKLRRRRSPRSSSAASSAPRASAPATWRI